MGKFSRLGNDLYNGRRSIDFVHRRPLWYTITGVVVLLAIAAIVVRGLNFGIEFTGGTEYRVPIAGGATQETAEELRDAVAGSGVDGTEAASATTAGDSVLIQVEELTQGEADTVAEAIRTVVDVPANDLAQDEIGASWGAEVAERAALGVAVFLVLVLIFIGLYFREWKMSIAAFVALAHDIIITIGVYALSGFQVTPSAVTGLLAILGFSLYDTVVVFDKIRENTHERLQKGQSYADAANLAVNQTLVRSINTGIVALIPIGAILYVSAIQLGASSLQDLALAQFVGMAVGVYSSVFLAPRVLVHMKSGESAVKEQERRAKARARAMADRYASVPTFVEDMPVMDDPDDEAFDDEGQPETRPTAPPRAVEASDRGRVAPAVRKPVRQSNAAGRQQPVRQPKSKRDKK
ncbi:protein translocase subunit SecF [Nocardioides sp. cx-173]|uniref:protein translocase subunit SecF n=1 Tax=Nocardioides sp. cx-173 TaxID=2898796 RepID=UPI001E433A7A|nr:protein translocase subunit SecF [Nocardioides sp. cx-173]MCD4525164.1 protein translocase subunit SecF [Nocardioides sp. cx-173]UGB40138.1 protein translocase subunit SecF [Nocardioides sp. cx-173]